MHRGSGIPQAIRPPKTAQPYTGYPQKHPYHKTGYGQPGPIPDSKIAVVLATLLKMANKWPIWLQLKMTRAMMSGLNRGLAYGCALGTIAGVEAGYSHTVADMTCTQVGLQHCCRQKQQMDWGRMHGKVSLHASVVMPSQCHVTQAMHDVSRAVHTCTCNWGYSIAAGQWHFMLTSLHEACMVAFQGRLDGCCAFTFSGPNMATQQQRIRLPNIHSSKIDNKCIHSSCLHTNWVQVQVCTCSSFSFLPCKLVGKMVASWCSVSWVC